VSKFVIPKYDDETSVSPKRNEFIKSNSRSELEEESRPGELEWTEPPQVEIQDVSTIEYVKQAGV